MLPSPLATEEDDFAFSYDITSLKEIARHTPSGSN